MTGLCERISAAPSKDAIDTLLAEGAGFKYASPVTKRRWTRLAARRVAELNAPPKKEVKESKKDGKK